jgi:hypothetical protein
MGMRRYVKQILNFAAVGFCAALSSAAQAGERYEFFNGIRSLGMGGAAVAVVNDETALISNPAALGKLRDYFITVVDPELSIGAETQAVIGSDITAFMDPQDTLAKINAAPKRRLHQRAQLFPSIVVPNFGFGLFAKYETNAYLNDAATAFNFEYTNDLAAVFGFNLRFFDGRLKIGVNARGVNRTQVMRDDILPNATGLTIDNLAKEGFGVASDAGIIMTAPWKLLPTLAVVYRDVGTTHYTMNKGFMHTTTERPDATPPTLDAAIAIFPILANKTRMTFTVEMRDIMKRLEPEPTFVDDPIRRTHGGIEFNFSDTFFLRGGMNQNYWTAGMELAVFNSQIQIASYGEEVGTEAVKKEDRRYVGKFAWRF